nr:MFS transporter [Thermoguttaceae bacterium]
NLGAFFGMYAFALITRRLGRRPTFIFFLLAAMFASLAVFAFARTRVSVLILNPLMGFSVASLLSGYTIYFPELFPTRVRSTSVSLCYNAGRYISAIGPFFIGFLTSSVYYNKAEPMAWAGATLCPIFLLGIILIFFLPETKDQPLPE